MKKFKCFIDYDKEEKWLNEMSQKGYQLTNTSFGYDFIKTQPENTIIKIDFRKFNKKQDYIDYCTMFEDSGWKHVSGTSYSGNQYFKKVSEQGTDDIFSDEMSRAGRYKRLSKVFASFMLIYFPFVLNNINNSNHYIQQLLNPKLLYYTPGLWEKTGISFWRSFLFETPFAMLRGFVWIFPYILIGIFLFYTIKVHKLYKYNKKTI